VAATRAFCLAILSGLLYGCQPFGGERNLGLLPELEGKDSAGFALTLRLGLGLTLRLGLALTLGFGLTLGLGPNVFSQYA
jgi:hypothetical protein